MSGASICTDGFQACDVRGRHGSGPDAAISDVHAFLLGRALARRLAPDEPLLLAGDGRATTAPLLRALEAGFERPATSLGPGLPTPLAYFAGRALQIPNVVVVTASHHDAAYNGFKIQIGDRPPTPDLIAELAEQVRDLFRSGSRPPRRLDASAPCTRAEEMWSRYEACLTEAVPRQEGAKVVVDAMHGTLARRGAALLRRSGFDVAPLRDTPADDFNGLAPDPSDDAALDDLRAAVTARGAAFGVAFDGDGDRARLVDEHGRLLDNGTVLVLLFRWLGRGPVVCDQKLRLAVVRALRGAGADPVTAPSGHAFIRAAMLDGSAALGGEVSGHFFWGEGSPYPVPAGDCGVFVPLVAGDLLRRTGRTLADLAGEVPASPFYTGDIRGLRYRGDRSRLLAAVAAAVRDGPSTGTRVDTLDGVRLETPASFALLRPSVTEPDMLTAVLDADDAPALAEIARRLVAALPPDAGSIADSIAAVIRGRIGDQS